MYTYMYLYTHISLIKYSDIIHSDKKIQNKNIYYYNNYKTKYKLNIYLINSDDVKIIFCNIYL